MTRMGLAVVCLGCVGVMQLSDFSELLSGGCWGHVKTERSKLVL
jgi:hypothetical protein